MIKLPNLWEHRADVEREDGALVLLANLSTSDDYKTWIKEFGRLNKTTWIVKSTKVATQRIACRKDYLCHHSSRNKTTNDKTSSKNLNCPAKIGIVIHKGDMRDMAAVITIRNDHSHPLNNAEVLSKLTPSQETKDEFLVYFDDGMTIREAINFHTNKLEMKDEEVELANGTVNPRYRSVRTWHDTWRKGQLGPRSGVGVTDKIKEKQTAYGEGVKIRVNENPFAVVIMTSLMQRAQVFANDIIFVDSTASCDTEHHTMTFVLTCTEAGAVPLAIIITKGQSLLEYEISFKILKEVIGDKGFGGRSYPKLIMTDDSDAERGALKNIFPQSELLLCTFHVGQSVWRWLCAKEHDISIHERQCLYKLFRDILIAPTLDDANRAYQTLISDEASRKYANWVHYINGYWGRRSCWCLCYRNAATHGHQTNNFAEINVRIYKDIVLSRCKAYNAVALVDFTCTVLEQYYVRRLRDYANGRYDKNRLKFLSCAQKSLYLSKDTIRQIDAYSFIVPSESNEKNKYQVDIKLGLCTCIMGNLGTLCKHIVGVYVLFFNIHNIENRYQIAKLALGDKVNPKEFYEPINKSEFTFEVPTTSQSFDNSHIASQSVETPSVDKDKAKNSKELMLQLANLLIAKSNEMVCDPVILQRAIKRLNKVNIQSSFESYVSSFGSHIALKNRCGSIRVQPTALSRWKAGVTRGSKRLPGGRPVAQERGKRKRPHNLAHNIKQNVPNATTH